MSKRRVNGQDPAIARTEALLHQAADFVPAESAPPGLAMRALARWEAAGRDCSPRQSRNSRPVLSFALVGAALFCIWFQPGSDHLPGVGSSMPETAGFPTFQQAIASVAQVGQHLFPFETGTNEPSSSNRGVHPARHRSARLRARPHRPPKAIWTVETVQTEEVGILVRGWAVQEEAPSEGDPESQPVHLTPMVVSVPLQSQVTTHEAPSGSPFPMPPVTPAPAQYWPQATDSTHSTDNSVHSNEEKTQP